MSETEYYMHFTAHQLPTESYAEYISSISITNDVKASNFDSGSMGSYYIPRQIRGILHK